MNDWLNPFAPFAIPSIISFGTTRDRPTELLCGEIYKFTNSVPLLFLPAGNDPVSASSCQRTFYAINRIEEHSRAIKRAHL
jgi:hypothetical protein